MAKTDYSKIELQPFGSKSLRIIFSVLEDIKIKMELGQNSKLIVLRYAKKIDDITESERRHAIDFLFKNNIIRRQKLLSSLDTYFKNLVHKETSFAIEVNKLGFDEIYQGIGNILTSEDKKKINKDNIYFEQDISTLFINDIKIKVAERKENTLAHNVLSYLLNNSDDFVADYSEIIAHYLGIEINQIGEEEKTKLFKSHYEACKNLNHKIAEKTEGKIINFLDISGSKDSTIAIDEKYRPIIAR